MGRIVSSPYFFLYILIKGSELNIIDTRN